MITVVLAWGVPLLVWGPQVLSVFVFSTAVAIFSCGAFAPRPSAYAAFPLGFGLLVLTSQVDPAETAGSTGLWSLNVVWIFGLGAWIRQRTALVEQARAESAARAAAAAADDRVRLLATSTTSSRTTWR